MDAIKKKMQSLKTETDNALQRAEELDKEAKEATQRAEKYEESVSFALKWPFLCINWNQIPKPNNQNPKYFFGKHWFFSQIISKKAKMIISFFYEKIQK